MKRRKPRRDARSIFSGVVFAVNARVLVKNCGVFDGLLRRVPDSQLLVWTATGEPPISRHKISGIEKYFMSVNLHHRVGFDCQICSNWIIGILYDMLVNLVALYWNFMNFVRYGKE
uniref:Uncharacterized protein n=1 Tax=Corethron hystrix TaxID=216773 RepID=A0A7S1BRS7_9STRA|mmetsp:Transcript_3689/g.6837  ORF Transcript_3689/g.6837 Transcript_3689/m.6837 type:complete len:116 (+) Transcript_3689:239-586(+)